MQTRYIVLTALGSVAAWATVGSVGSNKAPLEFTKPALPPPVVVDMRPGLSSAFLSMPIEIGPLARRAEQALPEKLAVLQEWLSDAACGRRTTSIECNSAKLEGSITRTGPVDMQMSATSVKLIIPLKYDLTATGVGWANYLNERKTGEAKIPMTFAVAVGGGGGLDVTYKEEPASAEPAITLLKGSVKLSRLLDAKLKPLIKATEEDLRRSVAGLPVRLATAKAWSVLAQPLELGQGSGLWLKGQPEFATNGSFVSEQGRLSYRLAIVSRMAIAEADRNQANSASKKQPVTSPETAAPAVSRIRMAVPIDLEAMRQVAEATFTKGQIFESRADRFSEPVKVKVRSTRIYPAMRQIGIELDVEVTSHKGVTHRGKLNLAGRPVLDPTNGLVTLADVTFPPVSAKDASGKEAGGQAPGIPRLGTEPFASKFAAAAKLDISRAIAEAMPRAGHMLNQRLSDDLTLTARLKEAVPVSLELARDGAWLLVDLTGDVMIVYDSGPGSTASVGPNPDGPAPAAEAKKKAVEPKRKNRN